MGERKEKQSLKIFCLGYFGNDSSQQERLVYFYNDKTSRRSPTETLGDDIISHPPLAAHTQKNVIPESRSRESTVIAFCKK